MPNHVHLILVPADADGLRRALAPAHRRYTRISTRATSAPAISGRAVSAPSPWTKIICGGAALCVVESCPGRAGRRPQRLALVERAGATRRARRRHHPALAPVHERYPRFRQFPVRRDRCRAVERLRGAESIGRPLGNPQFLDAVERKTRRVLKPAKRGPKPRGEAS